MITIPEALVFCYLRITSPTKAVHPNYNRVTNLAAQYAQLITGEDQEELLKKFFIGQKDEELEKIKSITQPITSSVCNSLGAAFQKVLRTQPILKKIDFAKADKTKTDAINTAIANYYANNSLDFYIEKRYHDISFLDPNSFIVTEFETITDTTKRAEPYPFEVSSAQAINFQLKNGVLQFLLVENSIQFKDEKGVVKDGIKLIMYLANDAITLTQVARTYTGALDENETKVINGPVTIAGQDGQQELPITFVTKEKQFEIAYFNHKQGRVPAIRVGYVPDKKTGGQTFVNPWHYGALPYLMKSIKSVAEMDLTTHGHTFPQKIVYVEPCSLDATGVCSTSNQRVDQCTLCGKKGFRHHTSAKDILEFKLPRNTDEMIDLSKLVHYAYPPIDGIKFQNDYIDALTLKCYKGVFNSEIFGKDEVATTATGKNIDLQNAHDPMSDYANKIADYWMNTIKMIGNILDFNDTIAEMKYPKDFKLKSRQELIADLQVANKSDASPFIIDAITRDIAEQLYQDRPLELIKYDVKARLYPFSGKTDSSIQIGINSGVTRKVDSVLYMYFGQIMEELEEESQKDNNDWKDLLDADTMNLLNAANKDFKLWFYDLPFKIQQALMYGKAQKIVDAIKTETPVAIPFGAPASGTGNP